MTKIGDIVGFFHNDNGVKVTIYIKIHEFMENRTKVAGYEYTDKGKRVNPPKRWIVPVNKVFKVFVG